MIKYFVLSVVIFIAMQSCAQKNKINKMLDTTNDLATTKNIDTATFGTGCFWCTEAIFQQVNGVVKVTSGYSGGVVTNPTYEQVCSKTTGHAECLNIIFDAEKIKFDDLLKIFWQVHNPTTFNKQGADEGTQYRSVVFYHNEGQKIIVEEQIKVLNKSGAWETPIVTTLEPFTIFYPAETYHQNYYNLNKNQGYCQMVIKPKLEKFEKAFKELLKK